MLHLRATTVVTLPLYMQVLAVLPAWLVKKLRLTPSDRLDSKLTCLLFQLEEFLEGKAEDIEDHYFQRGVTASDLTYASAVRPLYLDITTSTNRDLLAEKRQKIENQVAAISSFAIGRVRTIPRRFTMGNLTQPIRSVDLWDKFNKLLVAADQTDQAVLSSTLSSHIYPKLKTWVAARAKTEAGKQSAVPQEGPLAYDLTSQPSIWSSQDARIVAELSSSLALCDVIQPKTQVMCPLPTEALRRPTLEDAWRSSDPVLTGMLLSAAMPLHMTGKAWRLIKGQAFDLWDLVTDDPKKASTLFRYHGKGKTLMQKEASRDVNPMALYLLVSPKTITSPGGFSFQEGFSVASGTGWSGYASELLSRGHLEEKGATLKASLKTPVTMEVVQTCQEQHDSLLAFMSLEADGKPPSMASKFIAAGEVTGSKTWSSIAVSAVRSRAGTHGVMTTNMLKCLSVQYEVARTVTIVLHEPHSLFRFRVAASPAGQLLMAIGTGNNISRMTDVPISLWTPRPVVNRAVPRSRNRTISVSSRLMGWWLKLPHVMMLRTAVGAQHNLASASNLHDTVESVVEHCLMHLTTRQQDSLMQDQVRYVLAGMLSPEASREGPLKKAEGVLIQSPSLVVFWARMCRLQAVSFLTKSGMTPKLVMSDRKPPIVVPPQHSTPCVNYNMFVDAMFDSKIFNKDKDQKVDSQALDWLNLMKTERKFQRALDEDRLLLFGGSQQLQDLITRVVRTGSLMPLVADVVSQSSIWLQSATSYWEGRLQGGTSVDFGWNAAMFYTIAIVKFTGRRLSQKMGDFDGYLADLAEQSLSSFLSSSGSTDLGPPSMARQSVRKSTAILNFAASKQTGIPLENKAVGAYFSTVASSDPGKHQSLLLASLWVLSANGQEPILSRTETKEQSGGGREFSAMNAVGVITCRTAERVFNYYLPSMPVDRMTDPHTEGTLHREVTSRSNDRSLFMAADNSRFGPSQVMAKSRALAAALCMSDGMALTDKTGIQLLYELLAEPARLMQTKYSKMPHELLEFIKEFGGFAKIRAHNPSSTLGELSALVLDDLKLRSLDPGFTQQWGMYQGALGMYSSCASSLLHEFFCEVAVDMNLCATSSALVTNDDSLCFLRQVPEAVNLRDASREAKSLLMVVLGLGGQVLNWFKTVVSSFIAEFHSMFCLSSGLVSPELKTLVAGMQVARGEKMSDDAAAVVESGLSAVREGCSLFSAMSLAVCLTVSHCDQYNRWRAFRKHGCRPADLGGPVLVDLSKEMVVPGYGSLQWYARAVPREHLEDAAACIARGMVAEEHEGLLNLLNAGLVMTTRRIHRQARGNQEVGWLQPETCLPLPGATSSGALVSTVTSGLLRGTPDGGLDKLLVRFGRNQVSANYLNIRVPQAHWVANATQNPEISYASLDNLTQHEFWASATRTDVAPTSVLEQLVSVGVSKLLEAALVGATYAASSELLLLRGRPDERFLLVTPVSVRPPALVTVATSVATAISHWGGHQLKTVLGNEEKGLYNPEAFAEVKDESRSVLSTGLAFAKLVKSRHGPFKLSDPPSTVMSSGQVCLHMGYRVFRGVNTVAQGYANMVGDMLENITNPIEIEVEGASMGYHHLLELLRNRRILSDRVVVVPDGDVKALWMSAPSGWVHAYGKRIKIRRVGREERTRGLYTRIAYGLITETESGSTFSHRLLGIDTGMNPRLLDGWADYLKHDLPERVTPGYVYTMSRKDVLYVPSRVDSTTVVLEVLPGVVMASTEAGAWPILRVPFNPVEPQVLMPPIRSVPLLQALVIVLSGGNILPKDGRSKQLVATRGFGDHATASALAAEFKTHAIMIDLDCGRFRRYNVGAPQPIWDAAMSSLAGYGYTGSVFGFSDPRLDMPLPAWVADVEVDDHEETHVVLPPEEGPEAAESMIERMARILAEDAQAEAEEETPNFELEAERHKQIIDEGLAEIAALMSMHEED